MPNFAIDLSVNAISSFLFFRVFLATLTQRIRAATLPALRMRYDLLSSWSRRILIYDRASVRNITQVSEDVPRKSGTEEASRRFSSSVAARAISCRFGNVARHGAAVPSDLIWNLGALLRFASFRQ